jgi:tetrapyrrole methylase family protein / MazG family protein
MSAKIAVVGLGPGRAEYLSRGALNALRQADRVLLRTRQHPLVAELDTLGVKWESLDEIYDTSESLEGVYPRLADAVLTAAQSAKDLVAYGVPGHPLVAETSVSLLLEKARAAKVEISVIPSLSGLDLCLLHVGEDALRGLRIADAQAPLTNDVTVGTLFFQIDTRQTASDLKLTLLEKFPPEHEVVLLIDLGLEKKEKIIRLPLGELDHQKNFDHLTSLYVPPLPETQRPVTLEDMVALFAKLRSPEGCPWDREQDHQSMRVCLEEETREVLEAIEKDDKASLCEELGDVLLQVLFHAQLAAETGDFDIYDIMRGLRDKLVERHPHVFGDKKLGTAAEVLVAWEALKRNKQSDKTDQNRAQAENKK